MINKKQLQKGYMAHCQSWCHQLDTEAVVSADFTPHQTRCLDGNPKCWVMMSLKSGRWSLNSILLNYLDI